MVYLRLVKSYLCNLTNNRFIQMCNPKLGQFAYKIIFMTKRIIWTIIYEFIIFCKNISLKISQ